MRPISRTAVPAALGAVAALVLYTACGGGGAGNATLGQPATGSLAVGVTDAPTDAWSAIGVIVRKVVLIPQNGTVADGVVVYDGSADGAPVNLVHLDELTELLGTVTGLKPGTYDRVLVTVDGNPATLTLVPALDASGAPQAAIPAAQIEVSGVKDGNGWVTIPAIQLAAPVVIAAGQTSGLALDFDLAHPLFIVVHDLLGTPIYTVNFQVRHRPHASLDQFYLRHFRAKASSVAADAKSMVIHTVHGKDVTLYADTTNKTLFYDLDATPVTANLSFTVPASLTAGKYVKASARFQGNGNLTAVRVWYAAADATLPKATPEGHLTKVDTTLNQFRVLTEDGKPVTVKVDANTVFTFQGGTTPVGTGTAFLANLSRGFKVHVTVADVTAVPMVATAVDIQHGVFEGSFTAASATTGFTFSRTFPDATVENHTVIYATGFAWWNFAFPTVSSTDTAAFAAKAMPAGGALKARGLSTLAWVAGSGWAANNAIFQPTALSTTAQTITAPYLTGTLGVKYTPDGGTTTANVTVNLDTTAGSQCLVYEFTRGGGVITVAPLDVSAWATKLTVNARVRVFGIPRADGTLDAYVINLFD